MDAESFRFSIFTSQESPEKSQIFFYFFIEGRLAKNRRWSSSTSSRLRWFWPSRTCWLLSVAVWPATTRSITQRWRPFQAGCRLRSTCKRRSRILFHIFNIVKRGAVFFSFPSCWQLCYCSVFVAKLLGWNYVQSINQSISCLFLQ